MRVVTGLLIAITLVIGLVPVARAGSESRTGTQEGTATTAMAPRVGLLIVDHGEPPDYNELTYESFRKFFDHLMEMGLVPPQLKLLDAGTVTVDTRCPMCNEPSTDPRLMDAWLVQHDGPGVFVPESDSLPAHYVIPGGPGLGEPDIFEHVGLMSWQEWELMGGSSPNYAEKLPKKLAVIERLKDRYGDLPVRIGYGIDPRLNGERMDIRKAVAGLINRERVGHIVVAYHGVGFSDIMQTHMIRHEIEEMVASMNAEVTLSYAEALGTTDQYVEAVVGKARSELEAVPKDARVAIHLSGHGLALGMCGEYDCGADSYHETSKALFIRTKDAIERAVDGERNLEVFHIYGDGATEEDDPNDEMDSPMEALDKRKQGGFDYIIDIPYEFDSNSRDTLIILRQGYNRPIPDWNDRFESRFEWEGIKVKITNCSYGLKLKTAALSDVMFNELERILRGDSGADHEH